MAAATNHHAGNYGARDIEQTFDVGVDHLVPVVNLAGIEFVQAAAKSGVVDEDFNRCPVFRQRVNRVLNGSIIAHIEVDGMDSGGTAFERE